MLRGNYHWFVLVAAALAAVLPSCSGTARDPRDATDRANRSLARGDTAAAIGIIERIDLKDNGDPGLYILLGRLYRRLGTINGRLQSQRILESGLQRYPNDAGLLVELGKTYFAQTFYPDAIRAFNQALEIDSGICEAYKFIGLYYFNNWRRLSQYEDDLMAARRQFDAAVECDSTDRQSAVRLAKSLYALDRPEVAEDFCEVAIQRFPDEPDFYMLRGALAYDDGRYDDAQEQFRRGIERMNPGLARQYTDLFDMLSYNERFPYKEAPDEKRTVTERVYWIDRDPDPTTVINEQHLEHFYRMFIADLYFSCYRPPTHGWKTERGAAIVKFGWPWTIERTLGDSWNSGRIEKWYYIQRGKMREFVFEDEYLSGNLRIPIYADSMVVVLRYNPRLSTYHTETVTLPGALDVSVFKDDEFSSTLYMAAKVDADSLRDTVDLSKVNFFHFRGACFDGEWEAEDRFADTLWTSEVPVAREGRKRYYHVDRSVSLPFDTYHVACAFEDERGTARALLRGAGDSMRFVKGGLAVSDLLLLCPPEHRGGSFTRNGKTLYPNPGHEYEGDQRLGVYFEVYGLGVERRRSDYEVTFHIYEAPEEHPSTWAKVGRTLVDLAGFGGDRDPAVSQTIRRRGVSDTAAEEMLINVEALQAGRYQLVISIADRVTGKTAYASTEFYKKGETGNR
jgi:GWxTD domain-containing protein